MRHIMIFSLFLFGLGGCTQLDDSGGSVAPIFPAQSGASQAAGNVLVVDRADDEDGTFPCSNDAPGDCTLRAAITIANEREAAATIQFSQHFRIVLKRPLPDLTAERTTIIAEPGKEVHIYGAEQDANVLTVRGSFTTIEGLHLFGAGSGRANIAVTGLAQSVVIARNVIGDDDAPEGNCDPGRRAAYGIHVDAQSSDAAATRAWIYGNVIECHNAQGILAQTGNVVIGRDAKGNPLGNQIWHNLGNGIDLNQMTGNVVCNNTIKANDGGGLANVVFDNNSIMENSVK